MAVTSKNTLTISLTGDVAATLTFSSADNAASPGMIQLFTLVSGANTITLPTGGSTVKGATIIPPAGNVQTLTLKGISGDTGIALHKTDPTVVTFDSSPPASIILAAGGTITGLRIIWT